MSSAVNPPVIVSNDYKVAMIHEMYNDINNRVQQLALLNQSFVASFKGLRESGDADLLAIDYGYKIEAVYQEFLSFHSSLWDVLTKILDVTNKALEQNDSGKINDRLEAMQKVHSEYKDIIGKYNGLLADYIHGEPTWHGKNTDFPNWLAKKKYDLKHFFNQISAYRNDWKNTIFDEVEEVGDWWAGRPDAALTMWIKNNPLLTLLIAGAIYWWITSGTAKEVVIVSAKGQAASKTAAATAAGKAAGTVAKAKI